MGYGSRTTCHGLFVQWRKAGVWDQLMDAITVAQEVRLGSERSLAIVMAMERTADVFGGSKIWISSLRPV